MRKAYEQVMKKIRIGASEAVEQVEHLSRCNKYRYHAYIAYEAGELNRAWELLRESMDASRKTFLLDARSWLLACAIISRTLLPLEIHLAIFRWFVTTRLLLFKCRRHFERGADLPKQI